MARGGCDLLAEAFCRNHRHLRMDRNRKRKDIHPGPELSENISFRSVKTVSVPVRFELISKKNCELRGFHVREIKELKKGNNLILKGVNYNGLDHQ